MADVLKDELTSDPLSRGYAGMTDKEAVADLNKVRRKRDRMAMTSSEVWQVVDLAELKALAAADRAIVLAVLQFEQTDPFGNEATMFVTLFGATSKTVRDLKAARVESISRTQQLGLRPVKPGQVNEARR